MSSSDKARFGWAAVLGLVGLWFFVAAVAGLEGAAGGFAQRGGTVAVVLLCTALVLGFMGGGSGGDRESRSGGNE